MKIKDAKEMLDLIENTQSTLRSLDGMVVGKVNFRDSYSPFNKKVWEAHDFLKEIKKLVLLQ